MTRSLLVLAIASLLSTVATAQNAVPEARVDSIFAQYDNTRSPGCALGVIQGVQFVLKRGYGMADLEHGIPLSPSSVFRIGSTSKQFTAAATVLLAEEGKISLDEEIRTYLPEMRDYRTPVTVRHLLHHTSGVRDYLTLMRLTGKRDNDFYTDDEALDIIARQRELNFEPGTEYLYSNSGYFLLSQIVKRASGMSLRDYAGARIFEPLDMARTHFHDDHSEIVPNRAIGYAPLEAGGFQISMTTLPMVGDGGVFTSVEELHQWDQNFYHPRVGGNTFLDQMLTPGVLASGDTLEYAFGLRLGQYRGLDVVRHGGAFVGFRAEMMRFPEQRVTVICLCNLSTSQPWRFAEQVADVYLEGQLEPESTGEEEAGEEEEAEQAGLELSAEELAVYAGAYYSEELDVVYRLRVEADSLRVVVGKAFDEALAPMEPDVFRVFGITFRFQRDSDSRAASFMLDAGRVKNLRFRQVED